jgi:hypothetical protein
MWVLNVLPVALKSPDAREAEGWKLGSCLPQRHFTVRKVRVAEEQSVSLHLPDPMRGPAEKHVDFEPGTILGVMSN